MSYAINEALEKTVNNQVKIVDCLTGLHNYVSTRVDAKQFSNFKNETQKDISYIHKIVKAKANSFDVLTITNYIINQISILSSNFTNLTQNTNYNNLYQIQNDINTISGSLNAINIYNQNNDLYLKGQITQLSSSIINGLSKSYNQTQQINGNLSSVQQLLYNSVYSININSNNIQQLSTYVLNTHLDPSSFIGIQILSTLITTQNVSGAIPGAQAWYGNLRFYTPLSTYENKINKIDNTTLKLPSLKFESMQLFQHAAICGDLQKAINVGDLVLVGHREFVYSPSGITYITPSGTYNKSQSGSILTNFIQIGLSMDEVEQALSSSINDLNISNQITKKILSIKEKLEFNYNAIVNEITKLKNDLLENNINYPISGYNQLFNYNLSISSSIQNLHSICDITNEQNINLISIINDLNNQISGQI